MSATVETELKLRVGDAAITALPLSRPLRDVAPRTLQLDAIYYDTADRLLQRHGMALRVRREGRRWVQTLKRDTASGSDELGAASPDAGPRNAGMTSRSEWEWPLAVAGGVPRVDRARLRNTPAAALLRAHRRAGSLLPLFRVRVRRTLWDVTFRSSRIEVVLDRGRIEAGEGRRRATLPVAELELELKQGEAADLPALALRIAGRGGDALALLPATRGKAERGHRLAAGEASPVVKASAGGFSAGLSADMPAAVALRAIVAHGLSVLLANAELLHEAYEPEAVHQARVALRRVRTSIRQIDRAQHDLPPKLARELHWIARVLGDARDGDVLVEHTLPLLTAGLPAELRVAAASMLAHARERRDAARRTALTALRSTRFARAALELQAWLLSQPSASADRTLAQTAPRALERAHRRLFDAAQFFTALPAAERHRVRILAKRLRYTIDVFAIALDRHAVKPWSDALSRLQDVLGALNDAAVVIDALPRFTASRTLLEHGRRWQAAHEPPLLLEAEARLLALLNSPRPWAVTQGKARRVKERATDADKNRG